MSCQMARYGEAWWSSMSMLDAAMESGFYRTCRRGWTLADPRHHFIISPTIDTRHVDGVLIISGEGGFYYRRPSPLFAGAGVYSGIFSILYQIHLMFERCYITLHQIRLTEMNGGRATKSFHKFSFCDMMIINTLALSSHNIFLQVLYVA